MRFAICAKAWWPLCHCTVHDIHWMYTGKHMNEASALFNNDWWWIGLPLGQWFGMPGKMCSFFVCAAGKYGHYSYLGTVRVLSGLCDGNIAIQIGLHVRFIGRLIILLLFSIGSSPSRACLGWTACTMNSKFHFIISQWETRKTSNFYKKWWHVFRNFALVIHIFVTNNWTKHIAPRKSQQVIGFIFQWP
jgi:hypothetical protein